MKPADAYRLKYRTGQTIESSIIAGVDSLPDELLARILAPVDLKSLVQARAVCKSWRASVEGKAVSDLRATSAEPLIALIGGGEWDGENSTKVSLRIGRDGAWFDGPPMPEARRNHSVAAVGHKIYVLVTDDLVGDEREWQKTWWRSVFDRSMMEYEGCACAVVGREILIMGGPNDFHASDSDDLFHHLQRLEVASVRQGMGPMRPEMTEYVQQRWMNEASDTVFCPERGFRRLGKRLTAQSEGAAAAVVYV